LRIAATTLSESLGLRSTLRAVDDMIAPLSEDARQP
jgi:hypothetical protein